MRSSTTPDKVPPDGPDFTVTDNTTFLLLRPHNPRARFWIDVNIGGVR